ncbi:MAG: hypothetical protein EAX86_02210 [Candidatus Heimdallarchaeota archaeon]|nr:hypothetical protein [Candidatus Heimdallarchaeota archaeon]
MSNPQVHVYMPSMDGEYVPVSFTSAQEDLKDEEVLIFVNEDDKRIFIWTGANSNVRKRFISSQIARQMRLEKGLTHRISTEDQGNETTDFIDFLDVISVTGVKASAPIDVSPTSISDSINSFEFLEGSIPPSKPKIEFSPIKESEPLKVTPMPSSSPKNIYTETEPKSKSNKPPVEVKRSEILYYYQDQKEAIQPEKGQQIFSATDGNLIVKLIHVSSSTTEGKIAFYYLPKSVKTTSCKGKQPFFAIYLKPSTNSVIEIDDLEIPIPAGNSIYFSCPENTFISLNLSKE